MALNGKYVTVEQKKWRAAVLKAKSRMRSAAKANNEQDYELAKMFFDYSVGMLEKLGIQYGA
jgi:hypothetical protein